MSKNLYEKLGNKSFFVVPSSDLPLLLKKSSTVKDIYLYLYEYFSAKNEDSIKVIVSEVSRLLDKTEVSIRNGLRELKEDKFFLIHECNPSEFIILIDNEKNRNEGFENYIRLEEEEMKKNKQRLTDRTLHKKNNSTRLKNNLKPVKNILNENKKEILAEKNILEDKKNILDNLKNILPTVKNILTSENLETNNNNDLKPLDKISIDLNNRSLYIDTLTNYTNQETKEEKKESELVELEKNNLKEEEKKEESNISYLNLKKQEEEQEKNPEQEKKEYLYQTLLTWGFRNKVPFPAKAIKEFINSKDLERLYQVVESLKNEDSIPTERKASYIEGRYTNPSFKIVQEVPVLTSVPQQNAIPENIDKLLEIWRIDGSFNNIENAKFVIKQKVLMNYRKLNDKDCEVEWNYISKSFISSLKINTELIKEILGYERFQTLDNKISFAEAV